jgi:dolichol-phosphate mannosyltransferase
VIDADGQHPVHKIPELYMEIKNGADIAIASRYMDGGGIEHWSLGRKIISIGATVIARIFFPNITDPGSGFFAIRKEVLVGAELKPKGYKILVEILGKGYWKTVTEIPFVFGDRAVGESKLKQTTIIEYLKQLWSLTIYTATHHDRPAYKEFERVLKFLCVGVTGVVVNIGLLYILTEYAGIFYLVSSLVGIEASIISNFILNDLWTFNDIPGKHSKTKRFLRFHVVSITGLIINMVTLALLTEVFGVWYIVSSLVGILLAFTWNFTVNRRITWTKV